MSLISNQLRLQFAHFLSKTFGPPITLPLMLILVFWQSEAYRSSNNIVLFLILSFVTWVIPVLFFAFSLRQGWIDNIDATRRQERYATYTLAGLGWLGGLFIAKQLYTPSPFLLAPSNFFFPYYFLLFVMIALLVAITFLWKISVHAATITMFYLLINHFFYWRFFWVLPLPLLVMWARYEEKNHNILQLAVGSFLALFLFGAFLGAFGLLLIGNLVFIEGKLNF